MAGNNYTIKSITRTVLCIPFHERCRLVKTTRVNGWSIVDLYRVESNSGVQGIGENLALYGSPTSKESDFGRIVGRNVFDLLNDDSLSVVFPATSAWGIGDSTIARLACLDSSFRIRGAA